MHYFGALSGYPSEVGARGSRRHLGYVDVVFNGKAQARQSPMLTRRDRLFRLADPGMCR